jgi:hypothetical protein
MSTHRIRSAGSALALAILLILVQAPRAASADEPLSPFSARYLINYSIASAEMSVGLSPADTPDEYLYESNTVAKGAARLVIRRAAMQSTRFRYHDDGLRPLSFTLTDGTSNGEHNVDIKFDWDASKAIYTSPELNRDLELAPGTLDLLTVQIAVMRDLERGADKLSYTVVEEGELVQYEYVNQGEETVTVGAGEFEALKYELRREGSRRILMHWFAPSLGHFPVRMEQFKPKKSGEGWESVFVTELISSEGL